MRKSAKINFNDALIHFHPLILIFSKKKKQSFSIALQGVFVLIFFVDVWHYHMEIRKTIF